MVIVLSLFFSLPTSLNLVSKHKLFFQMLNSRNHPSKLTATIPANAAASEDHPLPQLPSFLPPTTTSRTSPRRLEQNPTQTPRNQRTPSWTKMRKTSPSNLIRILRSAHSPPLDSSCWSQRFETEH